MTNLTREPAPAPGPTAPPRRWLGWVTVPLMAVVVALIRVPLVGRPLTPDEGGYLLVASHWHPGTSTYGDFFLDRPPFLLALFGAANAFGGTVALRILGIAAAVATVFLAGRIGGRLTAFVAAVLVCTPLFGALAVDGELLAIPFVLASLAVLISSLRQASSNRVLLLTMAAGGLAALAALVKQNMIDAFVAAAVLLTTRAVTGERRDAALRSVAFLSGTALTTAVVLAWSWIRGTTPTALWDALYTFRAEAAAVIHASASDATPQRFHAMLLALLATGVPVIVGLAVGGFRHRRDGVDLRWAAPATLVWASIGAVAGGSYWLHYLVALIPGVTLLLAAVDWSAVPRWHRSALHVAVACATVSALIAGIDAKIYANPTSSDMRVVDYIKDHAAPGDTVVTGYGHPNIIEEAGLSSPYPYLWSLPARVRDSTTSTLTQVLRGPRAPRWLVVSGTSLDTWGIDATTAQAQVDARYRLVLVEGKWQVYELNQ